MANTSGGLLSTVNKSNENKDVQKKSIALIMNEMLESNGIKARINELLGKRSAQFAGSLVSLVNADANLQKVFAQAPMTIIQAGLRAAAYDLPVDPGLGYAYIVPFNNTVKDKDGKEFKRMEATFIMGYKGMYQLAMRTGVYKKLNVVDVREGELKKYNRLTEDIEIEFIENEDEREVKPIIGYCGYFRLVNGMEKTIYMTVKALEAHELKHRKGKYMGKGWRDDKDAMCRKTILRKLIGKWGVMSIDYQSASPSMIAAAEAVAKGQFDDDDIPTIESTATIEQLSDERTVDLETGEIAFDGDFTEDELQAAQSGSEDK